MTLCTRVRIPYELLRANRPGPIISPVAAAPPLCRRTCPQSRPYSAKRSALPCSGAERCALRPALWRPLPARFRGGAGPRGGCASRHFPVTWCPAGTTVPGMHCAHGRIGRVRRAFRVVTRNLKVGPMVPRGRPLIGRAAAPRGSKAAAAAVAAGARRRWAGSKSRLQLEPRPCSAAGASTVVLGSLAAECAMASLSFQSGGGSKKEKEEKGKNIQVVVRCR